MAVTYTSQPATNGLYAAYRPIPIIITTPWPIPSVVYCDIYVNGVYFRTEEKTQSKSIVSTVSSTFEFDIQDASQEVLKKVLGACGGDDYIDANNLIASVYVKVRLGLPDGDGFVTSDALEPIQGTGTTTPVAGGGTQSNTFIIVNCVLQHEDSQDLFTHLSSYRKGTWDDDSVPLTHRPDNLEVQKEDSDYFPIITGLVPKCYTLFYKPFGATSYSNIPWCPPPPPCVPVTISSFTMADANEGVLYSQSIPLSGTAPFSITSSTIPGWMSAAISGTNLVLSGTPSSGDVDEDVSISVTVENACGTEVFTDTIDVIVAPPCVPIDSDVSPDLPDGVIGTDYVFDWAMSGTAPFTINSLVKPSWMTVTVSGSTLQFRGTPTTAATDLTISMEITNCTDGSLLIDTAIDVLASDTGVASMSINNIYGSTGVTIEMVSPFFYYLSSGDSFPLAPGQSANCVKGAYSGTIDVTIAGSPSGALLELYKNSVVIDTISVSSPDTYTFSSASFTVSDSLEIKLS